MLGVGIIAARVAAALNRADTCSLVAACGRDLERTRRFATGYRASAYATYDEMLADRRVDVVYIATPNALHATETLTALAAGKHVLVEKPMALSVADARLMAQAADGAGLLLGVGFHLRHHPVHREIRRTVLAGETGDIAFVAGTFGSNWVDPPPDAWQLSPELAGHGSITGLGVHLLDLLPWLIGQDIVEVSALSDGPDETRPVEFLT